ncbi:MAG TPA: methyltransferase domain-containing protein [Acidimicrobiales bacterium]|nr:methyltransferase domain-containing protein [Acidimicrobiales bacterium]
MARYTHGYHDSVLRSHRWRTAENSAAYLLPLLTPQTALLDVGCGPGTITVDLASRAGRVVGLDRSPEVLAEAGRLPNPGNVTFQAGDVHALPFDDAAFDVVHAHQVLQHLADPVGALVEMARVCRPGGVVAARDGDYGGMTWYPADPALDRWQWLYREVARSNGGQPDAARHLLRWARQAGLTDVTATASVWCFATPDDRAWWGGLWAERVTASALADQAVALGLATPADLAAVADAWLRWADADDGWFAVVNGEVLARV